MIDQFPQPPCLIEGKRIYLRDVRIEDVSDRYVAWMNDPEIVHFTESRYSAHDAAGLRKYIAARRDDGDNLFLAIVAREEELHIGNIKIGPADWRHRVVDLGLIVGDRNYWGKGIAAEAISLITDYAFSALDLHKVTASCYAPNGAAIRSFEKAGYDIEGVRKSHWLLDGAYTDLVMLGRINRMDP